MRRFFHIVLCWVLCFWFVALDIKAQSPDTADDHHYFQMKSHQFNIGVGFPNKAGLAFSGLELAGLTEDGYTSPQFTLSYEYGLSEELGIGLFAGYWQAATPTFTTTVTDLIPFEELIDELPDVFCEFFPNECTLVSETLTGSKSIRSFSIGGRISYHYAILPKLDTYASVVGGFAFLTEKNEGDSLDEFEQLSAPNLVYFTSLGLRYFFNENWAFYGEVGRGNITLMNVGMTYRL